MRDRQYNVWRYFNFQQKLKQGRKLRVKMFWLIYIIGYERLKFTLNEARWRWSEVTR